MHYIGNEHAMYQIAKPFERTQTIYDQIIYQNLSPSIRFPNNINIFIYYILHDIIL